MSKRRAKTSRASARLVSPSTSDPVPELRVYMRHARACCYSGRGVMCAPGVRSWFSRYGLNYRKFLHDGMLLSEAETIDDEFARRVVALAHSETDSERR